MTRHNGLLPAPTYGFAKGKLRGNWCNGLPVSEKLLTCCRLAMEKSPTCYRYGMDLSFMLQTCFGLVSETTGKSPTCYGLATGKLVQCILALTEVYL